jgi:cell division septation protein DedD
VVAKESATPAPVKAEAPTKAASGGVIAVQVGALRSKADAEALARKLSGKGYATYILNPDAGAANPVYKVRVGNYGSQDEAERVKRRLQQEENLKPWITH